MNFGKTKRKASTLAKWADGQLKYVALYDLICCMIASASSIVIRTGALDTTYGDGPVSNEGWIYSLMSDIFAVWEPANGCEDEPASQWKTPQDGVDELYCWGKTCGGNPVVRCAWNGAHNYFGNEGSKNSRLVWNFVSRFTKESHLGRGEVDAVQQVALVHDRVARLQREVPPLGAAAHVQPARRRVVGARRREADHHRRQRLHVKVRLVRPPLVGPVSPHEREARRARGR